MNTDSRPSEKLMTWDEACRELGGVSKMTLRRWVKAGRIPWVRFSERIVRFRERDVLDFRAKSLGR